MEFACLARPCRPTAAELGRRCHLVTRGLWPGVVGRPRAQGRVGPRPAASPSRASGQLGQKRFVAHMSWLNLPPQFARVDDGNVGSGLRELLEWKHHVFFLFGPHKFSSCQHQLLSESVVTPSVRPSRVTVQ